MPLALFFSLHFIKAISPPTSQPFQFQSGPEGSHSFLGCECCTWEGCSDIPHALMGHGHTLPVAPLCLIPSSSCGSSQHSPTMGSPQTVARGQVEGNLLYFLSHRANQPSHQTLGHPKRETRLVHIPTSCCMSLQLGGQVDLAEVHRGNGQLLLIGRPWSIALPLLTADLLLLPSAACYFASPSSLHPSFEGSRHSLKHFTR